MENITKGKVTFKVNGKTLKDENGKVIYAKVVNGTATIENYMIPDSWNEGSTIQAVYSGSTECDKITSEKVKITIKKEEPTITTESVTAKAGDKITLKATITDGKVINTGKVVFKINGKTVKDENGKVIYAKVVNNTVNVEYTIPDSFNVKDYNITAVFIAPGYNSLENTKTLTITE
jgi:sensor domain CHASE-containing protein